MWKFQVLLEEISVITELHTYINQHQQNSHFSSVQNMEKETLIIIFFYYVLGCFCFLHAFAIMMIAMILYPNNFVKLLTYILGNRLKAIAEMRQTVYFTFNRGIFTRNSFLECFMMKVWSIFSLPFTALMLVVQCAIAA